MDTNHKVVIGVGLGLAALVIAYATRRPAAAAPQGLLPLFLGGVTTGAATGAASNSTPIEDGGEPASPDGVPSPTPAISFPAPPPSAAWAAPRFVAAWVGRYPAVPAQLDTDPGIKIPPATEAALYTAITTNRPLAMATQRQLAALGFYTGAIDGDFGGGSARALSAYLNHGVAVGRARDVSLVQAIDTLALDYINNRMLGMPAAG